MKYYLDEVYFAYSIYYVTWLICSILHTQYRMKKTKLRQMCLFIDVVKLQRIIDFPSVSISRPGYFTDVKCKTDFRID